MAKESRKWFYNSGPWRQMREKVLRRDGRTCAYCGARATEVHHLIELDDVNIHDPQISLKPDNLQSLCHDCHTKITMNEHGIKKLDCDMEYYFDADGCLQRMTPPEGSKKGV